MGSGGDLGRSGSLRKFKRVNVRFKLPYNTVWGQNLMILGSDPLLGTWAVKQGQWMTPHHEGDLLLWQVLVSVPEHFESEYSYCLVDEKLNVLKWEAGNRRVLTLPEGLLSDATVEIHDLWQVCGLLQPGVMPMEAFALCYFCSSNLTSFKGRVSK